MTKMLTATGFLVREAVNGKEAIELNREWKPNLILMDMVMPVIDGFEATVNIKNDYLKNPPVIIAITASVLEEETDTILSIGADDFIRKPFKEEELFYKIGKHCNLEFIYEDVHLSDNEKNKNKVTGIESPEVRTKIPDMLINEISLAAASGYGKKMNLLIEKVFEYDRQVAEQLSNMRQSITIKK